MPTVGKKQPVNYMKGKRQVKPVKNGNVGCTVKASTSASNTCAPPSMSHHMSNLEMVEYTLQNPAVLKKMNMVHMKFTKYPIPWIVQQKTLQ